MSHKPKQRAFCQVCHGAWPDGHYEWCPVKTGPPEPFPYIIEHLCDHLRELRREHPGQFYDTPCEQLLRTLDAGLESYYKAKQQ